MDKPDDKDIAAVELCRAIAHYRGELQKGGGEYTLQDVHGAFIGVAIETWALLSPSARNMFAAALARLELNLGDAAPRTHLH